MLFLNKALEYGTYLLVFLLPIQTRLIIRGGSLNGGYFEYGTISLYATDILLLALLAIKLFSLVVIRIEKKNEEVRSTKIFIFIGLIVLAGFISIFSAYDKLIAGYAFFRMLLGIGLFSLVIGKEIDGVKLVISFLGGTVLQALIAIWQFLAQSSFAFKWLGMAAHWPGEPGTSVVEIAQGLSSGRWLRAYGGLEHPNMLGGVLAISALLLVGLLIKFRDEKNRSTKYFIFRLRTSYFVLLTSYSLFLISLFFTFSRAAWLALGGGLVMALISILASRSWRLLKIYTWLCLLGFLLLLPILYLNRDLAVSRILGSERLEIRSINERVASGQEALKLIKTHPFPGVGLGNYTQGIYRSLDNSKNSYYYQPAHNTFLLTWAETGLLGLLGLVGLLLILSLNIFRAFYKEKNSSTLNNPLSQGSLFLGIMISLLVLLFLDHWLWSLHFGVLFFWLILGIMAKQLDLSYDF